MLLCKFHFKIVMNTAIIKAAGACMHAGNSFSSVHCAMPIIQAARVSTFSAFIIIFFSFCFNAAIINIIGLAEFSWAHSTDNMLISHMSAADSIPKASIIQIINFYDYNNWNGAPLQYVEW